MVVRLASIFVRINTYFERFQKLQRGIYQGIWLGLLSPDALFDVTDQYYASVWDKYQSHDHNRSGFFAWETQIIEQYFQNCQHLLIGSVGGGREALTLAKQNYTVDAFECSPHLLAQCQQLLQQENLSAQTFLAPPNEVPQLNKIYDGAIMGWGGYIHIPGRERRIKLLEQYHSCLKPQAPLLLSFFMRDPTTPQQRLTYQVARLVGIINRRSHRVELGDVLPNTFDHCFTRAEIESELAAAGFEILEFSTAHTPSNSSYPYAVARKIS